MDPLASFKALVVPEQNTIDDLAKLILDDDLSVVWGLFLAGTTKDMDSISSILLKFFSQHGREVYLMEEAITKEVQLTSTSTTLFRQNNFASKLLSTYCKRYGLSYISHCLNDTVVNVCLNHQDNENWSCEVDPSKLKGNKKKLQEQNYQHLTLLAKQILDRVLSSANVMPPQFKKLACHLKRVASEKFPDEYPRTTFASVGGFIFLRFICPALVVPQKYGLLEIPAGPTITRDFMLVSKLLQTIANGVVFSIKEQFLLPLNDFVTENQERVLKFLDSISQDDSLPRSLSADEICESSPLLVRNRSISVAPKIDSGKINTSERDLNLINKLSAEANINKNEETNNCESEEENKSDNAIQKDNTPILQPKSKSEDLLKQENIKEEKKEPTTFDDDTFSYGELIGIIQYLTVYWKDMKKHLVKMDNNLGTKHTEQYIQLCILLEKFGVTSDNMAQQFNDMSNKKNRKEKLKKQDSSPRKLFSRKFFSRSPRSNK